jgi:glycosyltransferase involved in cell wall biosynthesis
MSAKNQPLVSIVTPVCNGEAHLCECIESVLSQTYQNWEYIIVDSSIVNDSSSDETLEIAAQYQRRDGRIRIHRNDTPLPFIANHNTAFGPISDEGKYCKVVSANDWLFPECLDRMVGLAEENPSVGIVGAYQLSGGEGIWYVRNSGLPYSRTVVSGHEVCRAHMLGMLKVLGNRTSVMYRADLVRNTDRFFRNPTAEGDTSACLQHLRFSDFGFVHQVLSHERLHHMWTTTTSLETNAHVSSAISDCQVYGEWYLTKQEREARIGELLDQYYRYLAGSAFKLKGREFWNYHIARLHELGFRLDGSRLSMGIASKLLDLLLNPKNTVQRVSGRMRLNRALKAHGAVGQDKRRGLKTRATVQR